MPAPTHPLKFENFIFINTNNRKGSRNCKSFGRKFEIQFPGWMNKLIEFYLHIAASLDFSTFQTTEKIEKTNKAVTMSEIKFH